MTVNVPLDGELIGLLEAFDRPVRDAARELIVLELYRQGRISSGKAGELLGTPRIAFIKYASSLGIPYFDMNDAEWQTELEQVRKP